MSSSTGSTGPAVPTTTSARADVLLVECGDLATGRDIDTPDTPDTPEGE